MSDFDQRNHDFCKALADAQFAFIEAERRVSELQDENAKLREELESVGTAAYLYGRDDLKTENERLRAAAERDADVVKALNASLEKSRAESDRLRCQVAELEELLPENGRWFSAETVEAYATECRALKTLAAEMFGEHQRIYHAGAMLRQTSATREQMARWHSECRRWGIEVGE